LAAPQFSQAQLETTPRGKIRGAAESKLMNETPLKHANRAALKIFHHIGFPQGHEGAALQEHLQALMQLGTKHDSTISRTPQHSDLPRL